MKPGFCVQNPRIVIMAGGEYLGIMRDGQVDWTMDPSRALEYSRLDVAQQDAARFDGQATRETWTANGGRIWTVAR